MVSCIVLKTNHQCVCNIWPYGRTLEPAYCLFYSTNTLMHCVLRYWCKLYNLYKIENRAKTVVFLFFKQRTICSQYKYKHKHKYKPKHKHKYLLIIIWEEHVQRTICGQYGFWLLPHSPPLPFTWRLCVGAFYVVFPTLVSVFILFILIVQFYQSTIAFVQGLQIL